MIRIKAKAKEIFHEVLDIDHGLIKTFLALLSDPKKVVTHPDDFTKAWKYALYIVSISCLFTWFFIHLIINSQDPEFFWAVPKRMIELQNGYDSFYENSQPLKRLILGAAALYMALLIFFFKERKQPPGFFTICLYLMGHSVFIAFILQTLGIIILKKEIVSNEVALIGVVSHTIYLSYSMIRIFGQQRWIRIIRIPVVILILFLLYAATSTRSVHAVYYGILNRSKMFFRIEPDIISRSKETLVESPEQPDKKNAGLSPDSLKLLQGLEEVVTTTHGDIHHEFSQITLLDSVLLTAVSFNPDGEVSKVLLVCFSRSDFSRLWSTIIFEKINRYSPDPKKIFLRLDSTTNTAFILYRIPNDLNSTIQMASVNITSGFLNYTIALNAKSDDVELYDVEIDSFYVYLCGSVQNRLDNFDLGMIAKINKGTGNIKTTKILGQPAFASWASFRNMKVMKDRIILLTRREYKWLFLFRKTSWSVLTINKNSFD